MISYGPFKAAHLYDLNVQEAQRWTMAYLEPNIATGLETLWSNTVFKNGRPICCGGVIAQRVDYGILWSFVGSDVMAMLSHTRDVTFLEEGDVVEVTAGGVSIPGALNVVTSYPNLFQFNGDGLAAGYVVRVRSNGQQLIEAIFQVAGGALTPQPAERQQQRRGAGLSGAPSCCLRGPAAGCAGAGGAPLAKFGPRSRFPCLPALCANDVLCSSAHPACCRPGQIHGFLGFRDMPRQGTTRKAGTGTAFARPRHDRTQSRYSRRRWASRPVAARPRTTIRCCRW